MRCSAPRCVAGTLFFDLRVPGGEVVTIEYIAGRAPVEGEKMRCIRRTGTYLVFEPVRVRVFGPLDLGSLLRERRQLQVSRYALG